MDLFAGDGYTGNKKRLLLWAAIFIIGMVRQRGIEPPHPAPEAVALSTELLAQAEW